MVLKEFNKKYKNNENLESLKKGFLSEYELYHNEAHKIINLSTFELKEIIPLLIEIIGLYYAKEYVQEKKERIYDSGIYTTYLKPKDKEVYFWPDFENDELCFFINEDRWRQNIKTLSFFELEYEKEEGIKINNKPLFKQLIMHPILSKCPFLLDFVDMLIEQEVSKITDSKKRRKLMKNIEAEFLNNHINEIKKHHDILNEQIKNEYQHKLEQDIENSEKLFSKTLAKINSESEQLK